ncbi:MAG TPA: GGDEF domain-containing protein [Candidatus Dormibacteraeota bacterium]|nr:GGDEF domain-containing protein [Candidatus Dormibacteraeota bacterium]
MVSLVEQVPTERRELVTRAGRDRLAAWLGIHPVGLAALARESVAALCALLDVAWHADEQGEQYRREVATLRQAARRLKDLALQDSLTGLANRRAIDERLSSEWDRVIRYERPLAVLMGDLDHLKAVNDKYGHPVGDALLQRAGAIIRSILRTGDLPGRIGGDEFVVLCPETDREAAALVAEKLDKAMRETTIETSQGTIALGMSIGWAIASDAESPGDLMRRADEALYRVKSHRRRHQA